MFFKFSYSKKNMKNRVDTVCLSWFSFPRIKYSIQHDKSIEVFTEQLNLAHNKLQSAEADFITLGKKYKVYHPKSDFPGCIFVL